MGMDVYGNEPKSERGTYFRRNVWGWHPLWEYVETLHDDIAQFVEYGHTNDGDGLPEDLSIELAARLRDDVASGQAKQYVDERNQHLAEMPKVVCSICEGTGQRPDGLYGVEWKGEGCNGCSGNGYRDPWDSLYHLEVEDLAEFADFLADCGGFAIY